MALILVFLLVSMFVCLHNWRVGILLTVVVGFLQDPLRKTIDGEPVILVVLVGLVVMLSFIGFMIRARAIDFQVLYKWYPPLKAPLIIFALLVLVQSLRSFADYGNAIVTGIGMMSYAAPFIALTLAYHYCQSIANVRQLLLLYVVVSSAIALGVYLSFFEFDYQVLNRIGTGLVIYDLGTILKAHPGFMRSSDIAAWHLGAGICLLFTLVNARRSSIELIFAVVIAVVLFSAGLLTGRRKMIMVVVQYFAIYGCVLLILKGSFGKFVSVAVLAGMLLLLLAIRLFTDEPASSSFGLYVERGASVFSDAPDRMRELGFGPVIWALNRTGIFGGGVGIASQGTQYFIDMQLVVGGAGEGGLGKITVELGLPGLLICAWLAVSLFRFLWKVVVYADNLGPETSLLYVGLVSFLLSNVPNFMVASQVYGDLYILLLLGYLTGFVVALPKIVHFYIERQQQTLNDLTQPSPGGKPA